MSDSEINNLRVGDIIAVRCNLGLNNTRHMLTGARYPFKVSRIYDNKIYLVFTKDSSLDFIFNLTSLRHPDFKLLWKKDK